MRAEPARGPRGYRHSKRRRTPRRRGRRRLPARRALGQQLTASTTGISDADGLPSSFSYEWVRVDADGTSNPVNIPGETTATYNPDHRRCGQEDQGAGELHRQPRQPGDADQRGLSVERHGDGAGDGRLRRPLPEPPQRDLDRCDDGGRRSRQRWRVRFRERELRHSGRPDLHRRRETTTRPGWCR